MESSTREVTVNIIVAFLCYVGTFLNGLLVFVTIKSKSLRSRCNILLALNSLSAIPTLWGISFPSWVPILWHPTNLITLRACYPFVLPALIGAPFQSASLLCIGIERLLAVAFPIWYKSGEKFNKIFWMLIACCLLRTGYRNCLYIYVLIQYPDKLVKCSTGDMNQADIGRYLYHEGLVLYVLDLVCYMAMWTLVLVRRLGKSTEAQPQNWNMHRKLLISLTVIMAITLLGSIQAQVYRVALQYIVKLEPTESQYLISLWSSCLYAVSDSSNTPVLLIFSKDYREAFGTTLWKFQVDDRFKKLLKKLWPSAQQSTMVGAVSSTIVVQNRS